MTSRWLIVLFAAVALVVTPLAIDARPAPASTISAVELAQRVQASAGAGWSGYIESSGSLQVPDSDSFASLAQLLGDHNDLRAWWRSAEDWRVDRITSTGETDLFRRDQTSVRWVFESETATIAPVSVVRLPDASDLLPPSLARSMLRGARADELSRIGSQRVAGVDAPGLRLVPDEPATTVAHVDVWADPKTGLALRVDIYGLGDERAALTTSLRDVDLTPPAPATTHFVPAPSIDIHVDQSVDVAAAANAFDPAVLPAKLAGLGSRNGTDPGAVGSYGRGPTTLLVLPLRGQVAGPLRERLRSSSTARETVVGTLAPVGLVGLLMTPRKVDAQGRGSSFLLAGTVNAATLQLAAAELLARP